MNFKLANARKKVILNRELFGLKNIFDFILFSTGIILLLKIECMTTYNTTIPCRG